MKLDDFIKQCDLYSKKEIEKVKFLTYYHQKETDTENYSTSDVVEWFDSLQLPSPNSYRLLKNIRESSDFIKGNGQKSFKLHARTVNDLDDIFSGNWVDLQSVEHFESILPKSLYQETRGYIESIADQINSSFENNIYDGCAVLMRRLIEILLILTYKNLNVEGDIKHPSGDYKFLKDIINDARQNSDLDLSRNSKKCLEKFKTLGDFSAHKLHYTCKHKYIDDIIYDFRVTVEELLYKSNLK